jgi:DNA-binding IclR family transcriptional regulator
MTKPQGSELNHATGSQTLARGLTALQLVASKPSGLTVQEVAERIGVHRTIAYRLLVTLAQFHLIARGDDGRYRSAAGLAALGGSFDRSFRDRALPVLQDLADELRITVCVLIAEGDTQVAVAVVVPSDASYQHVLYEGSRYPLERGAAGIALLASEPPEPDERDVVSEARERGWVITHNDIEPGSFGLAVPVLRPSPAPATCINIISYSEDVVVRSRDAVLKAAARLSELLRR